MSWRIPDEPADYGPAKRKPQPKPGLYEQAVIEVLGSLLAGENQFLGRRVALAWPDGPPPEWSPDALQTLGRKWKRDARSGVNHWSETAKVAADADKQEAIMEALAGSTWFFLKRGENGKPDRLEPA